MPTWSTKAWLQAYRSVGTDFEGQGFSGVPGEVACRLNQIRSRILGEREGSDLFVHSEQSLKAMEYERIVHDGRIPTRDLPHDWYNGLVWIRFPALKAQLNRLHLQDESTVLGLGARSGNGRTRVRDALTLFDESGAVLLARNPRMGELLKAYDWKGLLLERANDWFAGSSAQECVLIPVGHGLIEAMDKPHKGLCAKVTVIQCPKDLDIEQFAKHELDNTLAKQVEQLSEPKDLMPLPVMGVPGWFEASKNPDFYADESVFRRKPTDRS